MHKKVFMVHGRYNDKLLKMKEVESLRYQISNVKLSAVFLSKVRKEEFKSHLLKNYCKDISFRKNLIIIRSKYTCIIFHKIPGKYHVNVTKIQCLDDVKPALDYIRSKYFPSIRFQFIKHNIDNISASCSLNRFISLHQLAKKCKNVRFNPERFPGCFLKYDNQKGTLAIFSSGSINILGCVNEAQIKQLWNQFVTQLKIFAL